MLNTNRTFFATAPKGVEPLLAEELQALGAKSVAPGRGGVTFEGTLAVGYRACLWSRTANRVLLPIAGFVAVDAGSLYEGVHGIPWEEHLAVDGTLVVDFTATGSYFTHSRFGAQKVKDAIVDRFRERFGRRPSVDRQHPDLRVNCYALKDRVTLSLDLSGESLHRRGYREASVIAPLKENLAAALLLKAGWLDIARAGGVFVDPLCGSGTLPIEAAWMAADVAPGLLRERWGFSRWRQHDPSTWEALLVEARQRRDTGLAKALPVWGYDRDARAIRGALINAGGAGVAKLIHFECGDLNQVAAPEGRGLVMANPPYGERLGDLPELESLYAQLGDMLKQRFEGWKAAVFTGNSELGKRMGLRARKINAFYNGALQCKLLGFSVESGYFVRDRGQGTGGEVTAGRVVLDEGAESFANRLRKNLRVLGRWARRQDIHCYRLYDADIPEYAVALDLYEDWVHVQEYEPPRSVDQDKARLRLAQVMAVIPDVLEVPPAQVFLKVRKRQKGSDQYEKIASDGEFHEVREGPCRFWVNFTDYLDTGLFLDHRLTRQLVGKLAEGRRFLNLFAYTGAASVYAALGGARSTLTLDMSRTYLDWAQRNLALNGISGPHHEILRADCLTWLDQARERFDLIFLDPPTFSNSKRMEENFDVQRDHVALIMKAMGLLAEGGILIFSSNFRRFKMDREALETLHVQDITRQTLSKDFERNPRIHHCWRIEHRH